MKKVKLIDVHKNGKEKPAGDNLLIPSRKKKGKRTRRILFVALVILLVIAAALIYVLKDLPSVESLKNFRPPVITEVYDLSDTKIGEFAKERRILTPLDQMPELLKLAFIASEDDRFYEHKGLDWHGILRALIKNILAGEVRQGGSTITQQVAKSLLLTPEKSLYRKMREAILASRMEKNLSKDEILYLYLNQIYLGHGAYGVTSAAQNYFGKNLSELNLPEMALLAGLVQAPSRYNPFTHLDRAKARQEYTLKKMYQNQFITREQKTEALNTEIELVDRKNFNSLYAPYFTENVRKYLVEQYGDQEVLTGGLKVHTTLDMNMQKAAIQALRKGLKEIDKRQGFRGPLEIVDVKEISQYVNTLTETNKDIKIHEGDVLRAIVLKVDDNKEATRVSTGLEEGTILFETMKWARKPNFDVHSNWAQIKKPSQALKVGYVIEVKLHDVDEIPKRLAKSEFATGLFFTLEQEPLVEGALVALDAGTGYIKVMVGGYDFARSEFNRATQAARQPGSAFKPVVYAAAIDKGYTAASMIVDAPVIFDDPVQELQWRPKNYGGKFSGKTIFRNALIKSRNVPTVKIAEDIGIDYIISYAEKMGITAELTRDFSLALGSSVMTPLELTKTYAVFTSGGKIVKPIFIRRIEDRDGHLLLEDVKEPSLNFVPEGKAQESQNNADNLQPTSQVQQTNKDNENAKSQANSKPGTSTYLEGGVISLETSYIITHLLKEVVSFGTGYKVKALGRPVAGKTGTTNDNVDAWFVGYTPTLVAGVWVGFDEKKPLGRGETGTAAASPIWLDFMSEAVENAPVRDFNVPEGIVFVQIDPKTGRLATEKTEGAVFEAFIDGTQPTETGPKETDSKIQNFFIEGQ